MIPFGRMNEPFISQSVTFNIEHRNYIELEISVASISS